MAKDDESHLASWKRTMDSRVTYAVVKTDDPQVFIAEDDIVVSRILALHVVAATPASEFADKVQLGRIRDALLDQRWDVAVGEWMDATGVIVDVFPDEEVWDEDMLDAEGALFEIRLSPIFAD